MEFEAGPGVKGIAGAADAWKGSLDGKTLSFAGKKADGSGITEAVFCLEYDAATKTLAGSSPGVRGSN